jgi:CRISPR-associated endonuclease/helicase Cas3
MTLPTPDRFVEFYKAAYGKQDDLVFGPFPWQQRVALRACNGDWPRVIALPTAAGKTACIDIAVFALACHAEDAPRRIFFTVDRRLVVDQAWLHAIELAERLKNAKRGILRQVADSLREIAQVDGDDSPLDVYALRGGMYRETAWVRSPLQPTIIASTVDQVGSRLLFRGYGVSDSMKPIHAGLVGNDALIVVDEAHCSRPFCQTLEAIEKYRQWNGSPAPFYFVSLTATPNSDVPAKEIERDRKDDRSHPVLGRRIAASKPTTLVVADKAEGKTQKATDELVKVLKRWVSNLAESSKCVGIIVNRLATARALKSQLGDEAVLLTGRMRPLDRDRLYDEKLKPLLSNPSDSVGAPPRFVIGTQCLEVGADFDFHALVTECASLDALRQRFGRLNRVAKRDTAKAVVVIRGDQTEPKESETDSDPIYGNSLPLTWKWLNENRDGESDDGANGKLPWIDFGIASIRQKWEAAAEEEKASLNAPSVNAPVLFPTHLDCWVQTHPIPVPDPDPAIFLHGPSNSSPDVQVVFRSDMGEDSSQWADVVAMCPPSSSEAVSVRIGVLKRWLSERKELTDTSGDVEGEPDETAELDVSGSPKALLWRGPTDSRPISSPEDVLPNAVYVVRTTALDARQLGDFPDSDTISDLGDEAFQRSRDRAILRLLESQADIEADSFEEQLSEEIRSLANDTSPKWLTVAIEHLANAKNRIENRHPLGGWVVVGKKRLRQFAPEILSDDDSSYSPACREVTLDDHSRGVADYARRFAEACKLEVDVFETAGAYHDLGKLDPRFQRLLKGYSGGSALAKSGTYGQRDRSIHQYPRNGRHELLSAVLISTRIDDDLLQHLIATHHGSARPFAQPVEENDAVKSPFSVTLFDSEFKLESCAQDIAAWNTELPERFWRIVRRYGWWGAAYREAIFRLADHARSREEQESECVKTIGSPPQLPQRAPQMSSRRSFSLPLSGLDGTNPLAFLAAVGTLRLASEVLEPASLRWEYTGTWTPVLDLPTPLTKESLVDRIHASVHRTVNHNAEHVAAERYRDFRDRKKDVEIAIKQIKDRKLRGKDRDEAIALEVKPLKEKEQIARQEWLRTLELATPMPFLSLGKSISASVEEFAAFASRISHEMHQNGPCGRPIADFVPAFGCEGCFDRNRRIVPTEFQLITGSGHQFFLDTFSSLVQSVTADQVLHSLFDTWTYRDPRLSFRWDPVDDRRYAVSWGDPSDTPVLTEHGANTLAAFALPLFPVIPSAQKAKTSGFSQQGRQVVFTWPIWESHLSICAIRSLIQLDCIHQAIPAPSALNSHGIKAVFRVRKVEIGTPPLSKLNFSGAVMV